MKKVILSMVVIIVVIFTSCNSENKKKSNNNKTETTKNMKMTDMSFGVRGNCGMCKNTIEKAVNGLDGITNANWNKDKKKIDVSFDNTKTNEMAIHKAIAASGYDTEKIAGSEEAYKNLPGCCKYDHNMQMNQ